MTNHLCQTVKAACRKGRNSFYALTDIGSPYLNPLTLVKLYKSVVLPSALYDSGTTCQQQTHNDFMCFSILSANPFRIFQVKPDQKCARPFSTFFRFHLKLTQENCFSLVYCVECPIRLFQIKYS